MHDVPLIATIAVSLGLAVVFGLVSHKVRLSPLIGYIVSGMVMGLFASKGTTDSALARQLAEIGIMMMMFGTGLHFSVSDLMAVGRLAIPGAIAQIAIVTTVVASIAHFWGWPLGASLVFGLSLSAASTVVLHRALEDRNSLSTTNGRVAVGWLIVEDMVMVLVLVLLPSLVQVLGGSAGDHSTHAASDQPLLMTLAITLLKVSCFVAISLLFGPRLLPWLLREVARTGSRELFTLTVLAMALGIAYAAAYVFDVSFALGAFFAGVVLNESELSHKAAANSLQLQDAFGVLFFVSVGMMFDPSSLIREPLMAIAAIGLVVVGKSIIAVCIVLLLRFPSSTALSVGASLAQIGEFSLILGGLGMSYGLLDSAGFNLILAAALFSILVNPLLFSGADKLTAWITGSTTLSAYIESRQMARLNRIQSELDGAYARAQVRAAAHKTFTPEELAVKFPLFANLTPEQREVLVLHFQPHSAAPGERIIKTGDIADAMYLISKGEVEVAIDGRHVVNRGPGEFFGEMGLLSRGRRTADVTALDYCSFAKLSGPDFHRFLKRYPDIRAQVAQLAAQRTKEAAQHATVDAPA
jgi:monovalent cation:H+ antiporter-2, CPA2 family